MLRLTDKLARLMPRPKKLCDVVALRMFGIGDALLFRMVVEKYAEALNVPPGEVTVLGSTAWADAAKTFFSDVDVILINERRFARSFFYRLHVMRRLRRRGFYTAICGMRFRYPHVIESLMLASGAPKRIVVAPRPNEKFDGMFAHYLKRMTRVVNSQEAEMPRAGDGTPLPLMHEIDHQLAFLSDIAGRAIKLDKLPKLDVAGDAPQIVKLAERYVLLNIGASHEPRRWPLESFFEIARRLLTQGFTIVILGGPAESGLKHQVQDFAAGNPRIIDAIGSLDFIAAARLVKFAALVISNDTGIGHLAIMMQRPSVLIVGGGHFGSFMPYPEHLTPPKVKFLHHLMPCFHCNWNCTQMPPDGMTFPCVSSVSVDDAWEAVKEIAS